MSHETSTENIVRQRMRAHAGCEKHSIDSRQQASARIRRETFGKMTTQYGGELRQVRRGMAFSLSKKIRKGFLAGIREKKAS